MYSFKYFLFNMPNPKYLDLPGYPIPMVLNSASICFTQCITHLGVDKTFVRTTCNLNLANLLKIV